MCDVFGISKKGKEDEWRAQWANLSEQHWVQSALTARIYGIKTIRGYQDVADGTLAGAMEVTEGLCDNAVAAAQRLNGKGPHRLLVRLRIADSIRMPSILGFLAASLFSSGHLLGQKRAFCYISCIAEEASNIALSVKLLNPRSEFLEPIFGEVGGMIFDRPKGINGLMVIKMKVDNHDAGIALQPQIERLQGVNHAIMFVEE